MKKQRKIKMRTGSSSASPDVQRKEKDVFRKNSFDNQSDVENVPL